MQKPDTLAKTIIGLAMKVHSTLGCSFGETVYRNALLVELRKAGIAHDVHVTLSVMYKDVEVGVFSG